MIERRGILKALGLSPFGSKKGKPVQALYQFQRKIVLPTGATSGQRIVIDSTQNAIFIYDASNNLVETIAAGSGVDPSSGQHYISGDTVYDRVNNAFVSSQAGKIYYGNIVSGIPDLANAGFTEFVPGSPAVRMQSQLSPASSLNDAAFIQAFPGAAGLSPPEIDLKDALNTLGLFVGIYGAAIYGHIGGGSLLETWQTPTAATNYVRDTTQYRRDIEDNVHWVGALHTTAASAGSGAATIFNAVPTSYRPLTTWEVPGIWLSSGSTVKGAVCIRFDTAGTVTLLWPSAVAIGDIFSFDAKIPLGNIP